jgi:hypothetical protein
MKGADLEEFVLDGEIGDDWEDDGMLWGCLEWKEILMGWGNGHAVQSTFSHEPTASRSPGG